MKTECKGQVETVLQTFSSEQLQEKLIKWPHTRPHWGSKWSGEGNVKALKYQPLALGQQSNSPLEMHRTFWILDECQICLDFNPISPSFSELERSLLDIIFQDKSVVFLFENILYESRKSTAFEISYSFLQQSLADRRLCTKHCAELSLQQ